MKRWIKKRLKKRWIIAITGVVSYSISLSPIIYLDRIHDFPALPLFGLFFIAMSPATLAIMMIEDAMESEDTDGADGSE